MWDLGVAKIDVFHSSSQHVPIVVTETNWHTWILSWMYASTDYRERRKLWEEITALVDQDIPTVVVGDFNCVHQHEDKRGGRLFVKDTGSREFEHLLHYNGLVDLGFAGPHFTWCNNRN